MSDVKATTTVPYFFRFILTRFEPIATVYGIYLVFADPEDLMVNYWTRGTVHYTLEMQVLYVQIAGMWAFLACLEFFVLPAFDNLRLWKAVSLSILWSDVLYFHAFAQAIGGWGVFWDVMGWSGWDWFNNMSLVLLAVGKLGVIFTSGGKGGAGNGKRS